MEKVKYEKPGLMTFDTWDSGVAGAGPSCGTVDNTGGGSGCTDGFSDACSLIL